MTTHLLELPGVDLAYDIHGPLPTADGRRVRRTRRCWTDGGVHTWPNGQDAPSDRQNARALAYHGDVVLVPDDAMVAPSRR